MDVKTEPEDLEIQFDSNDSNKWDTNTENQNLIFSPISRCEMFIKQEKIERKHNNEDISIGLVKVKSEENTQWGHFEELPENMVSYKHSDNIDNCSSNYGTSYQSLPINLSNVKSEIELEWEIYKNKFTSEIQNKYERPYSGEYSIPRFASEQIPSTSNANITSTVCKTSNLTEFQAFYQEIQIDHKNIKTEIENGQMDKSHMIQNIKLPVQTTLKNNKKASSGGKTYSCDECPYVCTRPSNLHKHKMTHSGEKPFKCDVCGYKCTQSGTLKAHKMTHSGEKPYMCNNCDYKCNNLFNLKIHKMTHTGEKPFKCDLCNYACTQSGHLHAHKMTHSGEKPFRCDKCDYKCRTSSHLKTHKKVHYEKIFLECDQCSFKFKTKNQLTKHKLCHI